MGNHTKVTVGEISKQGTSPETNTVCVTLDRVRRTVLDLIDRMKSYMKM